MKALILIFITLYSSFIFALDQLENHFSYNYNGKNYGLNYLIYKPSFQLDKYPLLIFLHGRGETAKYKNPLHPEDIANLKKHGPPKLIANNNWDSRLPFIVLSIQCYYRCYYHSPFFIHEIKAEVMSKLPIDENRIYMTGISMGGNGVMRYLRYYAEDIAAVVTIAGFGGDEYHKMSDVAWWGIHNRGDDVVPLKRTLEIYAGLKKTSRSATTDLTILEKDGHDAWTDTYSGINGLNIFDFLLKYSK